MLGHFSIFQINLVFVLTFDTTEKIKKKTDQIHRSLAAPLGFLQTKGQRLSVLEKCRVQMSEVCKKYM